MKSIAIIFKMYTMFPNMKQFKLCTSDKWNINKYLVLDWINMNKLSKPFNCYPHG